MDEYLESNLHLLFRENDILSRRMRTVSTDPSLEICLAESGDSIVRIDVGNGISHYIHSKIDPKREAENWVNYQRVSEESLVILGVGLAYHVFELLKKQNHFQHMYLIEADERLFRLTMGFYDLSPFIDNRDVTFLIGQDLEYLKEVLSGSLKKPFSYHIFLPSTSLHPQFYEAVKRILEEHLFKVRVNSIAGCHYEGSLSLPKGIEKLLDEMRSQ